jgi:anti-sigma factor ChrR (cupin superfamily)
MGTSEVLRYVQRGYDAPVQRTLDAHVETCEACRAEVDRARALQRTGLHALLAHGSDADAPLSAETLAAYAEGSLEVDALAQFEQNVGASYAAYRHYAAFERARQSDAAPMAVPSKALDLVLAQEAAPVAPRAAASAREVAAPSFGERLAAWTDHVLDQIGGVLAPRRLAPAGFAIAAVLALVVLAPWQSDSASVIVPGLSEGTEGVTFSVDAETAAAVVDADAETLSFTWEAAAEATGYQVFVTDAAGNQIGATASVESAEWDAEAEAFAVGETFTLGVSAVYPEGTFPIAQQAFVRR